MTFSDLPLHPNLIAALPEAMQSPTAIQQAAIPAIIEGRDVIALAQTGSGKTLAFALPLLSRVDVAQSHIQSLIIVPTRELAQQIEANIAPLAKAMGIESLLLVGGVEPELQKSTLAKGAQLVVATPGRLVDFLSQGVCHLEQLKHLVLDEADRLLEMGFWPDIQRVIASAPAKRQTLLFSATLPEALEEAAQGLVFAPKRIETARKNSVVARIDEQLYLVNKGSKPQALIALLQSHEWPQVMVFVAERSKVDALAKRVSKAGISTAALHGDKSQAERESALADFKSGRSRVLICTDLLARGIDIDALPAVVNFDLPEHAQAYVHRVGRTARAGLSGVAVSLVCHGEQLALDAIRRLTGNPMDLQSLAGFVVTDQPSNEAKEGERKRAPRDKKANRRSQNKRSAKQFAARKPNEPKPSRKLNAAK
ncbi:ATP-dependent RNA helicase RhlE [Vibrio stylophorae]|uniref:ATP-dependent RNA helicase RhlE n=1 Tax=Vibrio stylophorae TaxID=659351 RepID=A0ABN8DUG3_9VIBR|nr:DEAD/DEAH box helicase [Vibrio stylophorae]CAH0533565.1 ATP-dependent RNA helicase RhlE [Vibrio stylophorae]